MSITITLTADPDFSGPPTFLTALWNRRDEGEVLVASRYLPESGARMSAGRRVGSRLLNTVFGRGLSLGVRDLSSGIRLYKTSVVNSLPLQATGYDVLQEILVKAYAAGWRVREVPIDYAPNPAFWSTIKKADAPFDSYTYRFYSTVDALIAGYTNGEVDVVNHQSRHFCPPCVRPYRGENGAPRSLAPCA